MSFMVVRIGFFWRIRIKGITFKTTYLTKSEAESDALKIVDNLLPIIKEAA